MQSVLFGLLVLTGLIALMAVYAVPTIIALLRRHPNPMPVIVVNLLLGWTLLGWVASLAMAVNRPGAAVSTSAVPVLITSRESSMRAHPSNGWPVEKDAA